MKKVLAIMGSPRKNKNTDNLLDYLLEGVHELEYEITKVYLRDIEIKGCTGCDHCGRTAGCVFNDGMDILYDGFDNSDVVIFAAPIYFNSINGISKNIVDRCQRYWSLKYVLGQNYKRGEDRKGIFLSVGGAPFVHGHFDPAIPIMDFFFKAINANYVGNYLVSNTDNKSVKERQSIREELNEIGRNIDTVESFYLHR